MGSLNGISTILSNLPFQFVGDRFAGEIVRVFAHNQIVDDGRYRD